MTLIQKSLFFDTETTETRFSGVHSAKRSRNERKGVHAWHPYYAGYSEQFVQDVLSILAKPGFVMLDPWNGSGTTTLVAQYQGMQSVGVEINPVMAVHAAAKDLSLTVLENNIPDKLEKSALEQIKTTDPTDLDAKPIATWVSGDALSGLQALYIAIKNSVGFLQISGNPSRIIDADAAFLYSGLFQTLREVGDFRQGSNPTWLKNTESSDHITVNDVISIFRQKIATMGQDIRILQRRHSNIGSVSILCQDCRSMTLGNEQIDLVITSPPYCTRIDYAFATKPELSLLGYSEEDVDQLRKNTMGAPVIVSKNRKISKDWGHLCQDFLIAVSTHQSKASKTYYYPNFVQYFADAELSLREIFRVLKPQSHAILVVQSSFYKEVPIPLGEIYAEMGTMLGFHSEIAKREVVRQHMAHVNTKSQNYRKDKVYYEDVVLLAKPKSR